MKKAIFYIELHSTDRIITANERRNKKSKLTSKQVLSGDAIFSPLLHSLGRPILHPKIHASLAP